MSRTSFFYTQRRAILLAAFVLALGGLVGWNQMPKQEDPRFPDRFGSITVTFPGAGAETVERLIVLPLERELAEIGEIDTVRATARNDVAVLVVELAETIYDTDPVWDEVDAAVDRAESDFPDGIGELTTNYESTDLESVTYALTGTRDWSQLMGTAELLEERLLRIDGVKRVVHTPELDTQVIVELAPEQARAVGVSAREVAALVERNAAVVPGGSARLATRAVSVESGTDFASLGELRRMGIPLEDGRVLPLESIADVRRGPEEPVQELARYNGERALILGVVPQAQTDLIDFGRDLEDALPALREAAAPLSLEPLTYQPVRVERRLTDLQFSLLQGMLIVATVVMVAMGRRVGGMVAVFVPVVSLAALLLYYLAGGVLHQITIAALVVSLGLLVDNAIVVSERIQWHIDGGRSPVDAAGISVKELAFPLAAATGTTLAAFIPLLLSRGVSADFTRAIPQVVMLTLSLSFVFALTVVPTAGTVVLRPGRAAAAEGSQLLSRLASLPTRRPWRILAAAALLVAASASLLPFVQLQFFPGSDRNQVVLEMELPVGSTAEATSEAAWRFERELLRDDRVTHVAAFIGRSTPAFYYNLVGRSNSPNFGQLLVTTRSEEDVPAVAAWSRAFADRELPGITFVARPLEQGPPAAAPVEIRLFGENRAELGRAVRSVFEVVKVTEGTRDTRHDMDLGTLSMRVRVDEAAALSRRIAGPEAALAVLSRTRGIPAGEYRGGREPASIVVRAPGGRDTALAGLAGTPLRAADGGYIPLGAVASTGLEMRPSTINRRDGRNVASVYAELASGTGYNDVLAAVEPRLPALLPGGVDYEIGGVAENSGEANSAILEASYLGAAVLVFILVLQFRSFLLVGLVLLTVPLAAVGVVPGLFIFDRPFGFTSLLGAISLIGIVVNNAIILIDTIETKRARGTPVEAALPAAVLERMRPILLTVLTTVLALVPLLFSSSSLWPPFASAMISGLLASTVMTLLVVPAAYFLLFRQDRSPRAPKPTTAAVLLAAGALSLAVPHGLPAEELSIAEAVAGAARHDRTIAAGAEVRAAEAELRAVRREAFLPTLAGSAELIRRSEEATVDLGPFVGEVTRIDDAAGTVAVSLEQTVLDLARQEGARASQKAELAARRAEQADELAFRRLEAARAYLEVLDIRAGLEAARSSQASVSEQLARVRRLVEEGRVLRSEQLRLEVELRRLGQEISSLERGLAVARLELARQAGHGAEETAAVTTRPVAVDRGALAGWLAEVPRSVTDRGDIEALSHRISRLEAERRAVGQSALPRVTVGIAGVRQLDSSLEPDEWIEGSLVVEWAPFAGATRAARREALAERRAALEARYRAAADGGAVAAQRLRTAVRDALERISVAEQTVAQEMQVLEETTRQYRQGAISVSEYVDAESRLQQARVERRRAEISAAQAAFRLTYVTGLGLQSVMEIWLTHP